MYTKERNEVEGGQPILGTSNSDRPRSRRRGHNKEARQRDKGSEKKNREKTRARVVGTAIVGKRGDGRESPRTT
jgi:hypothetical protein